MKTKIENNQENNQDEKDIPQYVMMDKLSKKFVSYDPVEEKYYLKKSIKELKIWDYHWDKECISIPEKNKKNIPGTYIKFQKLTKKQLEFLNLKFS
jgi:hypothetical protein